MSNTLTVEKAESLVRLMTDGLVNIVDKTGEFLLKRKPCLPAPNPANNLVDDGTIIDTKGWQGWEWTHGIALTALLHVRWEVAIGIWLMFSTPTFPLYPHQQSTR